MRHLTTPIILSTLLLSVPALAQDATQPPPAGPPPAGAVPASSTPTLVAQPATAPSLKGLSVFGILPWGGFGVGAHVMFPLPGLGPFLVNTNLRDGFALEVGVDYTRQSYGYFGLYDWTVNRLTPVGSILWHIWLTDQFALYPKLELGYHIGWVTSSYTGGTFDNYSTVLVNGAGGALYRLANAITLRAEVGVSGLKVGAGWLF